MTPDGCAEGMNRIGTALRQPPDAATLLVYYDALRDQAEDTEWQAFCKWCVNIGRFHPFYPKVYELQDALQEFRGAPSLDREAVEAYERVTAAGTYTAEGGTSWTYRGVLRATGRAAAEAFLAAGGGSAWATSWRETDRRQAFVAAYVQIARQEPASRTLPPAQEPAQITAGDMLDQAEAAVLLERVRERLSLPEPEPERARVVASDARLAELRLQAAQIVSGEGA